MPSGHPSNSPVLTICCAIVAAGGVGDAGPWALREGFRRVRNRIFEFTDRWRLQEPRRGPYGEDMTLTAGLADRDDLRAEALAQIVLVEE